MKAFIDAVTSPAWWVGVVVVGIAINLLSAYLKPKLDIYLSRSSTWWRGETLKRSQKRQELIICLQADPHKQIILAGKAQRHKTRALTFFLFSVLSMLTMYLAGPFLSHILELRAVVWICGGLAVLSTLFGLDDYRLAV